MDDNVRISIKTYQDIDGDAEEPIELQTTGKFGVINDKYYIVYKESEMTGFADTTTTIKIWDESVTVTRKGKYNMKIDYIKGEHKLCLYPTPYGEIGASVKTFDVDYSFGDANGWLKVDYTIDADNENFCRNSLNVRVEPFGCSAE